MRNATLCSACNRVIYTGEYRHASFDVTNVTSRYGDGIQRREHQIDLCASCDTKVAVALSPLLPHLARDLDPNHSRLAEVARATTDEVEE